MSFRENLGATVAAAVNRQIASKAMNRYAENLPCFQVDHNLPDVFKELLGRLEQAEEFTIHDEPPRRYLTSSPLPPNQSTGTERARLG